MMVLSSMPEVTSIEAKETPELYYIILYYIILFYNILYYTILYYITLYYIILNDIILNIIWSSLPETEVCDGLYG